MEEQLIQTKQFRKSHVPPRFNNMIFMIYVIKKNRMQGQNTVEEVLCLSAQRGYTVFYRNCADNNIKHLYFSSAVSTGNEEDGSAHDSCVINTDRESGLMPVADFVFGDEHQWHEVRRRMIFELEHTMNIYLSLFGSAERVYELIRRTQWRNGHAPPEHWLDTPDSCHSKCIQSVSTLVIRHLAEQQQFIKLQMRDGCPLSPFTRAMEISP
ncbi:hypothetical protein M9H77_28520 [Catharanthus roseus]|uniref:Uncharacterized protein n=1 Tax=Catharanthus roseus TaxID=4058 RepID=A0ACC0AFK4_CATRO|nr:hypothetical protein M9H77_28520 [Catharanthus roseus]